MSTSQCIICDLEILAEDKGAKTFKAGGINSLIQSSLKRKDGKHRKMKKLTSIIVHGSCYVMYNRESSIIKAISKSTAPSRSSRRISGQPEPVFDFRKRCLFCGEDASDEFIERQKKSQVKSRKFVGFVKKPGTKDSIIKAAYARNDVLSNDVFARIIGVEDLVEIGARYHTNCYSKFFNNCTHDRPTVRPVDPKKYEVVQFVIDHLTKHKEECQFSLVAILSNYEADDEMPDRRYILRHLKDYFAEDIVFHTARKDTIICFRDVGGQILSDDWYENRLADEEEERDRIIKTAALLIMGDIRSKVYDTTLYSAPKKNSEKATNDIPKTLQLFLDTLIKRNKSESEGDVEKWNKRVNFYGHSITSSVRPHSFKSPLLRDLSSTMLKENTSKDLIDSFSELGLCSSYEETLDRDRQSCASIEEIIVKEEHLEDEESLSINDDECAELLKKQRLI